MLKIENDAPSAAKIVVIGIGGGGGNAVNTMVDAEIKDVSYIAINTDKQDLDSSKAEQTLQIGQKTTGGLGAGGNPEKGQASADENIEDIERLIADADMVFITAGMGGGTGTGAAPVVAKLSKDLGKLTVGVVTRPFGFEGRERKNNADKGIGYLKDYVDSLVVVPNDRLIEIASDDTTIEESLAMANDVLRQGVQGITDVITIPGLINLDFADVRTVMSERGVAHMGIGVGEGDNRVEDAVEKAIHSPLLETSIDGAKAVLINIAAGKDVGMKEINKASSIVAEIADEASIFLGTSLSNELEGKVTITVIATGFDDKKVFDPSAPITKIKQEVEKSKVDISPEDELTDFEANIAFINKGTSDSLAADIFSDPVETKPIAEEKKEDEDLRDFTIPDFLRKE